MFSNMTLHQIHWDWQTGEQNFVDKRFMQGDENFMQTKVKRNKKPFKSRTVLIIASDNRWILQ